MSVGTTINGGLVVAEHREPAAATARGRRPEVFSLWR